MKNIKSKAGKGFLWDLTGTFAQRGIHFVISIFLARLLEPAEFGVVGMALVFIHIFQLFADFGFASALIQNKENTSLTYSSIFYLNIVIGFFLFGIFQLAAPYIGEFYNNEEITSIVKWLAVSFIISSFNIVQQTILRRNIDFKKLTIRTTVAHSIGGVFGVLFAFLGFGSFALVAQTLIGTAIGVIILWKVSDWYPKFEFSLNEIKKLTSFSSFMFLDRIFSRISNELDTFLIGKFFSPAILGYYTRANSLNKMVTQFSSNSLQKVFFPVLSQYQDDAEGFNKIYEKVISTVCLIAFFLSGIMVIWGEAIIVTLFGPKWEPSVFIFQIIIFKSFSYPVNVMMVNAFLSKGKSKENFYIGLGRTTIRFIPLIIGFFYGFNSFLYSYLAVTYLITILNIYFLQKILNIGFMIQVREIFTTAVPMFIMAYFYFNYIIFEQHLVNNVIYTSIFVPSFLVVSYLTKNEGIIFLLNNYKLLLNKIKKKHKNESSNK